MAAAAVDPGEAAAAAAAAAPAPAPCSGGAPEPTSRACSCELACGEVEAACDIERRSEEKRGGESDRRTRRTENEAEATEPQQSTRM
jgi:hypothetical protein